MKTTPFSMTVNNQEEADFFINHLKPEHTVLEWGSGASTIEIAKHVKKLCSIEHNEEWFNKVVDQMPQNVHLCHVPYNRQEGPGEDGNYEEYQNYVDKAKELAAAHGLFDIIFIDGRARVACASICEQIAHKDTLVFIHDYNHPNEKYLRKEYFPAEVYLNRLDGEFTMYKFNVKAFENERIKDAVNHVLPSDTSDKKKVETALPPSLGSLKSKKDPAKVNPIKTKSVSKKSSSKK